MKRWIQFIFAFMCIFSLSIAFSGCFGPNIQMKLTLNAIDKVHVEYGDVVFVKDGNEIYAKSAVYADRKEVYLKQNLYSVFASSEENEQKFVSFRWNEDAWQRADNDTTYATFEANAHNYDIVYGSNGSQKGPMTSNYIMNGFSYVNNPFLDGSEKLEQKQN